MEGEKLGAVIGREESGGRGGAGPLKERESDGAASSACHPLLRMEGGKEKGRASAQPIETSDSVLNRC